MIWTPTRAAGLAQMEAFAPRMGRAYSAHRNTDLGPGRNDHVSALSPWIRRRLVTEAEAVRAALAAHGPRGADKFVQEVLWRTYWKGWLEMRPEVWTGFEVEVARLRDRGEADTEAVRAAEAGRTGIEGFDDWARELVETGWLHNHARMWFASIWIFTLRLPWELGADFFLRHLMDGDPASNTLSWRWVAGLQTRGKTYLAEAEIIHRCTEGRFRPRGLATEAIALEEAAPPEIQPLPAAAMATPDGPHLLLITAEDLTPEDSIGPWEIGGVVSVSEPGEARRGLAARAFLDAALADAEVRAAARYRQPVERVALDAAALVAAARAAGARGIVTPYAPVGPTASALSALRPALAEAGLDLVRVRRPWDEALWPLATRGFFPFREKAPAVLGALGLPV